MPQHRDSPWVERTRTRASGATSPASKERIPQKPIAHRCLAAVDRELFECVNARMRTPRPRGNANGPVRSIFAGVMNASTVESGAAIEKHGDRPLAILSPTAPLGTRRLLLDDVHLQRIEFLQRRNLGDIRSSLGELIIFGRLHCGLNVQNDGLRYCRGVIEANRPIRTCDGRSTNHLSRSEAFCADVRSQGVDVRFRNAMPPQSVDDSLLPRNVFLAVYRPACLVK